MRQWAAPLFAPMDQASLLAPGPGGGRAFPGPDGTIAEGAFVRRWLEELHGDEDIGTTEEPPSSAHQAVKALVDRTQKNAHDLKMTGLVAEPITVSGFGPGWSLN